MVDLVLDTQIRDWVLLPIFAVIFMAAIFRHYVSKLLKSDKKQDLKSIRET
jgi:hypothetical protein